MGRLRKHMDIRQVGDKNVGAANVYRQVGRWSGLLVALTDIGKGALAMGISRWLSVPDPRRTGLGCGRGGGTQLANIPWLQGRQRRSGLGRSAADVAAPRNADASGRGTDTTLDNNPKHDLSRLRFCSSATPGVLVVRCASYLYPLLYAPARYSWRYSLLYHPGTARRCGAGALR